MLQQLVALSVSLNVVKTPEALFSSDALMSQRVTKANFCLISLESPQLSFSPGTDPVSGSLVTFLEGVNIMYHF